MKKKEYIQNNRNQNKGVSLIVLVITIIVIIILAAAVILTINNNNPMDNANKARYTSDRANVQDALSTAVGKIAAEKLCSVTIPAQEDIASGIGYNLTGANDGIAGGKIGWDTLATVSDGYEATTILGMKIPNYGSNTKWFINSNGEVAVEVAGITYGPGGSAENLNGGTRVRVDAAWNKPYVPAGFSYIEGTVDTGYVIQDSSANQYVWVPVDGANVKYEKNFSYKGSPNGNDADGIKPELTCGGFYVGRYEAGKVDEKVVIKQGISVWNNIDYPNAKQQASEMKKTYRYAEGTTNLLTGTQWDSLMSWLVNKGFNVEDSGSWGNHSNATTGPYGTLQVTGKSETWKAQNIYDLAGNVWEWTNEVWGEYRKFRGSSYYHSVPEYPVSYRASCLANEKYDTMGFRVALYFE